jgi:heme-degrading monooxygenase HmoA
MLTNRNVHYVIGIVPFGLVVCSIVLFTVWQTRYDSFLAFVLCVEVKKFWSHKLSDMSGFKHRLREVRKFPSNRVRKCRGFTRFAMSSILKNKGSDCYVLWMTRDVAWRRLAVISMSVHSPGFLDFQRTKSHGDRFLGNTSVSPIAVIPLILQVHFVHYCHCSSSWHCH